MMADSAQADRIAKSLNVQDDVPVAIVEVSVSARNLADMDTFSKSDPVCIMYMKEFNHKNWREVDRTEIVWNNLNPDFVKKFILDYYFEKKQELKFDLYDVDDDKHLEKLNKQDFLGGVECTLGNIVSCGSIIKNMKGGPKNKGTIHLTAEEQVNSSDVVIMEMVAENLDKKDFFGKSDPFLMFYKKNEDSDEKSLGRTLVHKTEVIKNTLNPKWKPIKISIVTLCNGDNDRDIIVECYDHDFDGGHDFIGSFTTNLRKLSRGVGSSNEYKCINQKKKMKKGAKYKDSGTIKLVSYVTKTESSILDYVRSGTEIHVTIAVDMTSSNGSPDDDSSLHYCMGDKPNMYVMAIKAVGEVLEPYDRDNLIPAYGFGAKIPPSYEFSDRFPLNENNVDASCRGVSGIVAAYESIITKVKLHGPTNFSPIINHVAKCIKKHDGSVYHILLILTDGVISDMSETKRAIVQASSLPLSIIIIGIGNEDFEAMQILDGDHNRVSYKGKEAERDIVQFVAFREFLSQSKENIEISSDLLAKDVLVEIPEQFTSYMKKKHIHPKRKLSKYTVTMV